MNKIIYAILALTLFVQNTLHAQDVIAKGGSISTQYPGLSAAENESRLIDKSASSKYLTSNPAPMWILWACTTPQTVAQYTLISGNDAPGRDPTAWTLEASNDAAQWTTLDTRTAQAFSERMQTKLYAFTNTTAYTYYRLTVTALFDNTSAMFQLSELGLYEAAAPPQPTNFKATATGGQEVYLQWKDNTDIEKSFEIERSINGTDYTPLATPGPNVLAYTDAGGLSVNTTYHYRIRAVNDIGNSSYADVTVATLPYTSDFTDLIDDGGTLTVKYENGSAGESSAKLIDNDVNTKYLIPSSNLLPFWVQFTTPDGTQKLVTKYTITSANDAASRDMKDWTFEGSDNGTSWTTLDTRSGVTFGARLLTVAFGINTPARYKHYRLNVTANGGSTIPAQIAEWALLALDPDAPEIPGNLTAQASSKTEVQLTWQDQSATEDGFAIERSLDGSSFNEITRTSPNETTYTDADLTAGTTYHYRVRATTPGSNSLPSAVATATTPGINVAPTLDDVAPIHTCNTIDAHTVALTGITVGAELETEQTVSLAVTTDNPGIYQELAVSEITGTTATLSFTISPEAEAITDTIRIKVMDNGGSGNGGVDTFIRKLVVYFEPLPVSIAIDTELPIARGATVHLTAAGADTYLWSDGPGILDGKESAVLTLYPSQSYRYTVAGSTAEGCVREATFLVQMDGGVLLEPINILTPDNDGKNDKWIVWNLHAFPDNEVKVYDRAGKEVFSMINYTNDWNGTYHGSPLANGVYFYIISPGPGIRPLKGSITIIRDN